MLSLPKLTQVLAATLVDDGWLEPELKDDLRCLADTLDWFLNLRKPGTGYEWVAVRRESLEAVLNHVWKSEFEKFRNLSVEDRRQHVFRAAVDLKGLLTGLDRPGKDDLQDQKTVQECTRRFTGAVEQGCSPPPLLNPIEKPSSWERARRSVRRGEAAPQSGGLPWYFVCRVCGAKWFSNRRPSPCPRCQHAGQSQERLSPPWWK